MANVVFETSNFKEDFGDLEEGTYFKYDGCLFIKTYCYKDPEGIVNAFNISLGEFDCFSDISLVEPILEERIEITVRPDG